MAFPYYAQSAGFTCGAASLVMALHRLRGTPTTRSMEFEVWRDGTLVGMGGMDQWGLAFAAQRRGVPAVVVSEAELTFPTPSEVARQRFTEEQLEIGLFNQHENRRRATEAGVRWERREPRLEDIPGAIAEGRVPVLLVDLLTLSKDYAAPHWVVVAEASEAGMVLHDPDPDGPGARRLSLPEVWEAGDVTRYNALRTLVLLGP